MVDKGCVMTSVYCKMSLDHKNMSGSKLVIITDLSGKIIGYENATSKKIKIPLVNLLFMSIFVLICSLQELFQENPEIQLQKDIKGTNVCICSVNMLMSFSENVDHQNIDDFIHGTLVDQEVWVVNGCIN